MDTKVCAVCNQPFERPVGLHPSNWQHRQFCSRRCAASVPRDGRYVTDATKQCAMCGESFGPSSGQRGAAWERRLYCSPRCAGRARSAAAWDAREKRECPICQVEFAVRFPGQATCGNRDCKAEYRRTILADKVRASVKAGYASGARPPGRGVSRREIELWPFLADLGFVWRIRWTEASGRTLELDFAHWEDKLDIEIDGEEHAWEPRKSRDASRDAILAERGWRILRVSNADVDADPTAVVERIRAWI